MASLFGFGPSAKVEIELAQNEKEKRKTITVDGPEGAKLELPIFTQGESIEGKVRVVLPPGKKLDHIGIRLEVIGIRLSTTVQTAKSLLLLRRAKTQGQLDKTKEYDFKFENVNMQYESYNGTNVSFATTCARRCRKGATLRSQKSKTCGFKG